MHLDSRPFDTPLRTERNVPRAVMAVGDTTIGMSFAVPWEAQPNASFVHS
jgi:hypothetical protein